MRRPLQLLVFGGSQGARVMADIVPAGGRTGAESRPATRLKIMQQAREEDIARVRDIYARAWRRRDWSRRSSPTCRRGWRRAIWWCRARAPRRSPSWPRSAGRPSWCRCRMRSTRTSAPMRRCWKRRAARSASTSQDFTPEPAGRRDRGAGRRARAARRDGGRRAARPARLDAADRLADLVLRVAGADTAIDGNRRERGSS